MKRCPACDGQVFDSETQCPKCGNHDFTGEAAVGALVRRGGLSGGSGAKRAVPFVPLIKASAGKEAQQCADQLSKLIENIEGQGWSFSHLEDVTTLRNNGCLAFSNPTSIVVYQVAIFEKRHDQ